MSRKHDMMIENNESYPRESGPASRSFFAVLILCLIAVGGVAAATFSDAIKQPPLSDESSAVSTTVTTVRTTTTAVEPVAAVPATTTSSSAQATTTTTAPQEDLVSLPLSNRVLMPYSETPVYHQTLDSYRAHTATDFYGEEGQIVRTIIDGVVTAVEQDALWGGCVTIDHGAGMISVYRGITPSVSEGDELNTADTIGTVGAVPCESHLGPHLHAELYKDGKTVDIASLFEGKLETQTE